MTVVSVSSGMTGSSRSVVHQDDQALDAGMCKLIAKGPGQGLLFGTEAIRRTSVPVKCIGGGWSVEVQYGFVIYQSEG